LPKLEWWCWNCCGKHGDSSICLLHHSTWTVRVYKHTDHTVYALRSPVMFHRPKTENARQLPNEHFVESHLLVVNSLMLVKKRRNATYMSLFIILGLKNWDLHISCIYLYVRPANGGFYKWGHPRMDGL
jgi:hypothetical protein